MTKTKKAKSLNDAKLEASKETARQLFSCRENIKVDDNSEVVYMPIVNPAHKSSPKNKGGSWRDSINMKYPAFLGDSSELPTLHRAPIAGSTLSPAKPM